MIVQRASLCEDDMYHNQTAIDDSMGQMFRVNEEDYRGADLPSAMCTCQSPFISGQWNILNHSGIGIYEPSVMKNIATSAYVRPPEAKYLPEDLTDTDELWVPKYDAWGIGVKYRGNTTATEVQYTIYTALKDKPNQRWVAVDEWRSAPNKCMLSTELLDHSRGDRHVVKDGVRVDGVAGTKRFHIYKKK
jgi:hypothetical protein